MLLVWTLLMEEAYSEHFQTWLKPLTIFGESSILDVWHSSDYAYECSVHLKDISSLKLFCAFILTAYTQQPPF